MENLKVYLNFANTENEIATDRNKHWIIYADPTRQRHQQCVKLFYPDF